jgi:coenzyme F420-dependent glucose-6-phosphate dehydrogenase
VPPAFYTEVLHPALEKGARDAGKDPSKLEKFAWVSTFFHPDEEKALEAARRYGGLLIPECYHLVQDPRIIEQRALLIRDDLLKEAFGVATDPGKIIERFEAFIKAGCNHILWVDGSPDPDLVAEVCRKEVLPELRRRYPG